MSDIPSYDVDMLDEPAVSDPHPHYRAIRDAGPVVWLPKQNMYAAGRFKDVQAALRDAELFCSGKGVGFDEKANSRTGNLLQTDPPAHGHIRKIVGAPLALSQVNLLRPRIEQLAEELVEGLVARGSFDAVSEFAHYLPLTVVVDLVGLPEEGRPNLLQYAMALGRASSGDHQTRAAAFEAVINMRQFMTEGSTRGRVKPGGWIEGLWKACDAGLLTEEQVPPLMRDYIGPSLHTTIVTTTSTIWFLAKHPEQWQILKGNPALIPNTVNEALRLEAPIHGFTRIVTRDTHIDNAFLPSGSRIWLIYASANRDERKWADPDKFDIERRNLEHLGFGHGTHMCVGMHLARLEIHSLLKAMVKRIGRIDLVGEGLALNGNMRRVESLPISAHAVHHPLTPQ